MNTAVNVDAVYAVSDEVVAREIEGEMIIVPLTSDVGDMEDELYTLNETGKKIWDRLDGKTSLKDLITQLSDEYDASFQEIKSDVLGLMKEFLNRNFFVEIH
jgi:Coenzyme PQQ synthesis protein D (PqqD)